MKLRELIKHLQTPDHLSEGTDPLEMEVVFHSETESDMMLLSVYEDEGRIHIDVG